MNLILEDIENKVNAALENIRPYLLKDGGDVEFVRFDKASSVLELRLLGNCKGCPLSLMTLRGGIERHILTAVPEIRRVEAVS